VEILHLFGPRGDRAVIRTGPSLVSVQTLLADAADLAGILTAVMIACG
jgi:hypothetical protein